MVTSEAKSNDEKRSFARQNINKRGWATFATGPRFDVFFKNISDGGAMVELTTSRNFSLNDNLSLTMAHSGGFFAGGPKLSRRAAKIVRIDQDQSQRRVKLGVRFNGPVS